MGLKLVTPKLPIGLFPLTVIPLMTGFLHTGAFVFRDTSGRFGVEGTLGSLANDSGVGSGLSISTLNFST